MSSDFEILRTRETGARLARTVTPVAFVFAATAHRAVHHVGICRIG